MKRLIIIVIAAFFLLITLGAETPLYSVKGRIYYKQHGVIYILLMEEEIYREKKGMQTPYQMSIAIGPGELEEKSVRFEIPNVPSGRYCLVCYQDTNNNKKMDKGLFGPTEPWCIYHTPPGTMARPHFKDIAFYVVKDISGIEIKLQ